MVDPLPETVVLDTTVLSNFASSGSIEWLSELLERPAAVPAVREELEQGLAEGYEFLSDAIDALDDAIMILELNRDREDVQHATTMVRERLDPGESESLLGAIQEGATLASDDLAARRLGKELGTPVTGSVGLLAVGVT